MTQTLLNCSLTNVVILVACNEMQFDTRTEYWSIYAEKVRDADVVRV